jgi:hypothetical protein
MLPCTLPPGFITPCLPTETDKLRASREWLHEIKHDGFRIIARKSGSRSYVDHLLTPTSHRLDNCHCAGRSKNSDE